MYTNPFKLHAISYPACLQVILIRLSSSDLSDVHEERTLTSLLKGQ